MKTRVVLQTLWMLLLVGLGLLGAPQVTHAQSAMVTCSITTSPTLNFGTIDGLNSATKAQATVGWTCQNPSTTQQAYVTFCINIGDGSRGVQGTNRLMTAGTGQNLQFQMYQDSADSMIWGSLFSSTNSTPYQTTFLVAPGLAALVPGTYNGTATVYGVVPSAQTSLTSGSYLSSFGGTDAELTVASSYAAAPPTCGLQNASNFSFTASATVTKSCTVTAANNLDFGATTGVLTSNTDTTTTVQTQCTGGTPFQIGLDRGQHASGDVRRMLGSSGELITYELYKDSVRSDRWGNTQDVDTVSKTGNGAVQSTTAYGRIAPQTTPTPGTYTDTITVSVVY